METHEKSELEQRRTLEKAQDAGDKRYAFKPVEWIVYGMVVAILGAFMTALISKVIVSKEEDSQPAHQVPPTITP